jgi:hypothetical protein
VAQARGAAVRIELSLIEIRIDLSSLRRGGRSSKRFQLLLIAFRLGTPPSSISDDASDLMP